MSHYVPDGHFHVFIFTESKFYAIYNGENHFSNQMTSGRINHKSRADIMEADDRQVTTVFTVQPSFHHWHSTNRVHIALPSSANMQSHLTSSFADDGSASCYSVCQVPRWKYGWTLKTVVTWGSSASMRPAPGHFTNPKKAEDTQHTNTQGVARFVCWLLACLLNVPATC